jgi:AraC family transcriptional regulator, positive regulator of tynA and feaB
MELLAEEQAQTAPSESSAEPERWQLQGVAGIPVRDAWSDILAATHLAFDVRFTHRTPDTFRGSVTRRRFGDLALLDCECSPFAAHRSRSPLDCAPAPIFGFQFLRKGVERVREGFRREELAAGDIILWDGGQPVDVEVIEPFVKRTLIFPYERVLAACPRLAEVKAIPPLKHSGAARLLVRYLDALALELHRLDPAAAVAAADAALELLRAAVEPGVPTSRATRRVALRAQVRRYVRANLQDAALGPLAIASAHAISVRALHALFEETQESVGSLVRRERLARCMADLELPSAGSVTEIAFRWGFSDAAHFSRVFKREFGLTPSDVRRAALEGAAPRQTREAIAWPA